MDNPEDLRKELERRRRAIGQRETKKRTIVGLVLAALVVVAIGLTTIPRGVGQGPANPAKTPSTDRAEVARKATVSTSGDILVHSPVWYRALSNGGGDYDFAPMFGAIEPFVRDVGLAVCHLETPLTSGEPSGYPLFATPIALAEGIRKAGWEACSTASNHTLDRGEAGIEETVKALREAGVAQTGSAPNPRAARRPLIMEANGIRIGLVSYTDFNNTGDPPNDWNLNVLAYDEPVKTRAARVRKDVNRAIRAGAETVLVVIQWGTENSTEPNDSQRSLARAVTRIPGVAAIAGQGPHVVQPIERINGKFVMFSAGNLLSNQSAAAGLPAETQYGLIALFRFRSDEMGAKVKRLDYAPVWVRPGDYLIEPVGWGLRNDPANAAALRAAWESTVGIAGQGKLIRPMPRKLGPGP